MAAKFNKKEDIMAVLESFNFFGHTVINIVLNYDSKYATTVYFIVHEAPS